jgi:dihydroorotase
MSATGTLELSDAPRTDLFPDSESALAAAPQLDPLETGPQEIRIRRPDDFHCHFRQGELLERVAPLHAPYFGRVLAMPNPNPPIETGDHAQAYHRTLSYALGEHCDPLMTIMLTEDTNRATIRNAKLQGVIAAKLYPRGATTNSRRGVENIFSSRMHAVFTEMQSLGMVLCGHFEDPNGEISDRERDYIKVVSKIASSFPKLRIVVEHLTTAEMANWVRTSRPGVAGTITAHHLVYTLNDVLGVQGLPDYTLPNGGPRLSDARTSPAIRPHHYCLPIPQKRPDRRILIAMAVSRLSKFFLGTDSAPHEVETKECACGCAGCFVPGKVALATLTWVFEMCGEASWPRALEMFASENGAHFYGLPLNEGTITFRRQRWTVPDRMADLVPFAAGQTLPWEPVPE